MDKTNFINENNDANIRDHYQIGKILGSGAFGEVRMCTHKKTGIKRAVKIVKKSFFKGKEQKKFLDEVEILKQMVISLLLY